MFRVLNMNYYQLSEPDECKAILDDYKLYNDSIAQWWDEVSAELKWDMLPWRFLYMLYKHWFEENNPSGKVQRSREFIEEMRLLSETDTIWMDPGKGSDGRDRQLSGYIPENIDEPLGKNCYLIKVSPNDGYKYTHSVGNPINWQGRQRGLVRRRAYYGQKSYVVPTTAGQVNGVAPGTAGQAASVALIRDALGQRKA